MDELKTRGGGENTRAEGAVSDPIFIGKKPRFACRALPAPHGFGVSRRYLLLLSTVGRLQKVFVGS